MRAPISIPNNTAGKLRCVFKPINSIRFALPAQLNRSFIRGSRRGEFQRIGLCLTLKCGSEKKHGCPGNSSFNVFHDFLAFQVC